jgi:ribosomal protein L7/L12
MHGAIYLHSPNTPSWHGAQLKHSDNFTFYLLHLCQCHVNVIKRHRLANTISVKYALETIERSKDVCKEISVISVNGSL